MKRRSILSSRRGFLRGLGLAGAGIATAASGLGGVAHAVGGSIDVYPTGDADRDLENLQAAVFAHDVVHLKTYRQGDPDRVFTPFLFPFGDGLFINKDVSLVGDAENGRKPQIAHGGGGDTGAVMVFGEVSTGRGPTVELRGIAFFQPHQIAIYCLFHADVTITDCDVIDFMISGSTDDTAWGILLHTKGRAEVRGCYVRAHEGNRFALSEGCIHFSGFPSFMGEDLGGADIVFEDNVVVGTCADASLGEAYPDAFYPPHHGISAVEFYPDDEGRTASRARIENNLVAAETGILCWGKNGRDGIATRISGNRIVASAEIEPTATRMNGARYRGLWLAGPPLFGSPTPLSGAVITNNAIRLDGDLFDEFGLHSCAMYILGDGNDCHGNAVTGRGDQGVYLLGGALTADNFIHGNEMDDLAFDGLPVPPEETEPGRYYLYYFDAGVCDNAVRGFTGGKVWRVWDPDGCNDVSGSP